MESSASKMFACSAAMSCASAARICSKSSASAAGTRRDESVAEGVEGFSFVPVAREIVVAAAGVAVAVAVEVKEGIDGMAAARRLTHTGRADNTGRVGRRREDEDEDEDDIAVGGTIPELLADGSAEGRCCCCEVEILVLLSLMGAIEEGAMIRDDEEGRFESVAADGTATMELPTPPAAMGKRLSGTRDTNNNNNTVPFHIVHR